MQKMHTGSIKLHFDQKIIEKPMPNNKNLMLDHEKILVMESQVFVYFSGNWKKSKNNRVAQVYTGIVNSSMQFPYPHTEYLANAKNKMRSDRNLLLKRLQIK